MTPEDQRLKRLYSIAAMPTVAVSKMTGNTPNVVRVVMAAAIVMKKTSFWVKSSLPSWSCNLDRNQDQDGIKASKPPELALET